MKKPMGYKHLTDEQYKKLGGARVILNAKSKAVAKKRRYAAPDKGDKRPGMEGSGKFGSRRGHEYLEQ